jgi:hypothetical protein
MRIKQFVAIAGLVLFEMCACATFAYAQATPQHPAAASVSDTILLTIFLKHDQSKPLGQINKELTEQGFYKAFPPGGTQVQSWYVMMGIGQVVTLRLPASKLREVNRAIENTAWGAFKTEFYATYDFLPVANDAHREALNR